ncbi:type II toxin-antitoxin system VapC family toxin [Patulibacter sp. NPDC049589]|uniref:type II toxin-antitoxin system VapC family toxin n=1 Tax=Patulibacter sp. NPDC049589 TaxID=3154731 RepID=UPI00341ACCFD
MVLDTSALVAVLTDEPDRGRFTRAMADAPVRAISAATLLESSVVLEARFGEAGGRELDLLLHRADVRVVPVDERQAEPAAWPGGDSARDGTRRGSNYGDCCSYALAVDRDEPLLFKGDDFAATDVRVAGA